MRGLWIVCAVVIGGLVAGVAPATAAPPANDPRATPQPISLPAAVTGTTVESTVEADEPGSCQPLRGSLYYELRSSGTEPVIVRLSASGDLDAVVDVFQRTRSQLTNVGCASTDADGNAALSFQPQRGGVYLIRVGQRLNSAPGAFRLEVATPEPPPRAPGAALRGGVAQGRLDALQNERDAWSYSMRAGATYRFNVAARSCVTLLVYPPGTRDFARARPVRRSGCDGYLLFTPRAGEGGRHSLVVEAERGPSGEQRYRLQAAQAAADDTAPGLLLANLRSMRGSLRGGELDAVDLYRFAVDRRSALEVSLEYRGTGTVELAVLDDKGRQIAFGSDAEPLTLLTPRGRYYVAVRTRDEGGGRYTLRRVSRTITRTAVTIDGKRSARVRPVQAARVRADVSPGVAGRVGFTVERFDPLAGWQFFRRLRATAVSGSASVGFAAPSEGRWRVRAAFEGTRTAAPSQSAYATLNALTPTPQ